MSANALVTTRINSEIKKEASEVLASVGLTISDVIRVLLTKIAREHAIPFNPLTPNEETIKAMLEAREGGLPSVDTIEQFKEAMNAEDNLD